MPLLIVGAGHVFKIEEQIHAIVAAERPDVVALELDPPRYRYLLERQAGRLDEAARAGAPRIYRNLAKFQESIAESLGTDVGNEMLAAAGAATRVGSRVELIDANAQELVTRVWKEMTWRERFRLFFGTLAARLPWRRKVSVEAEIKRYEKDPSKYLAEFGRQFPTLKRILLDERNEHMAARLRALGGQQGRVVAVVGDGHVDGLLALLRDLNPRVVRLDQLRKALPKRIEWRSDATGTSVGFSFEQTSLEEGLRPG